METDVGAKRENRSQRITNILLLNASFIENLGLMHGKMGIAIYFFHLFYKTKNLIYNDYAGELIDEIYDEITVSTPMDFENGLAGIGWGIEYLVQNGFIEADTDDVLEDFDNRLQSSKNQIHGIGLLKGHIGLGTYYLKRIKKPALADEKVLTLINKQSLFHVIDKLELTIKNEGVMNLIKSPETFSLTWDYPVLIAFLTEVYQLSLFNFKVSRILDQLIDPLFRSIDIPMRHSKRLLLTLAIEKIKRCKIKQDEVSVIDEVIRNLIRGIDRAIIAKELTPNSAFMQNGTSGIAWIYNQLFRLTGEECYQKEALYWRNCSFEFDEMNLGFAGFNIAKEDEAFGILNGLAGINLIQL